MHSFKKCNLCRLRYIRRQKGAESNSASWLPLRLGLSICSLEIWNGCLFDWRAPFLSCIWKTIPRQNQKKESRRTKPKWWWISFQLAWWCECLGHPHWPHAPQITIHLESSKQGMAIRNSGQNSNSWPVWTALSVGPFLLFGVALAVADAQETVCVHLVSQEMVSRD